MWPSNDFDSLYISDKTTMSRDRAIGVLVYSNLAYGVLDG